MNQLITSNNFNYNPISELLSNIHLHKQACDQDFLIMNVHESYQCVEANYRIKSPHSLNYYNLIIIAKWFPE